MCALIASLILLIIPHGMVERPEAFIRPPRLVVVVMVTVMVVVMVVVVIARYQGGSEA